MKKVYLFIIALALIEAGCSKSTEEYPTKPFSFDTHQKSLLKSNNVFGASLFSRLNKDFEGKNVFISPISVSVALGMTLNGARDATYTDMSHTLGYADTMQDDINKSFQSIISQLTSEDPKARLQIANSIWYRQGLSVEAKFIESNKTYFLSEVIEADFTNPATLKTINDWVAGKTNNKILNIIDQIPADAVMYLINAIYFKGDWKYEFKKENTQDAPFMVNGATSKTVPIMSQTGSFRYYSDSTLAAIEMPYAGERYSLVALLPNENVNIEQVANGFTDAYYTRILENMYAGEVQLYFPRVKMEFKTLLNDALSDMGMQVAFSDYANFKGIRPEGGLSISRVIHQSFVEINEEGTEAAAATVVEIKETSMPEIHVFRADRPFLFVIKDNTANSIVFIGKVVNP